MNNRNAYTQTALKALALAGLLAFAAQPAMALDTPDAPVTASAPATPMIEHAVPETSAAEVEVADDIIGGQAVEAPEMHTPDVGTPSVSTPSVGTPEVEGADR